MSHKGWRRSIYTAWAEAAHITIASLKDLMSFFHIRLFPDFDTSFYPKLLVVDF